MSSLGYKEDLSGLKFNRLTVSKFHGRLFKYKDGRNNETLPFWECVCDCGKTAIVEDYKLKKSKTLSCGCYRLEEATKSNTKHGRYKTPEYYSWDSMVQRCTNPNNQAYSYYGGKGVKVCDRWLNSFENFYEDMGEKPYKDFSIDRIEGDGNYEPLNCRWSSKTTQSYNRGLQSNNKSGVKGVCRESKTSKWVAQLNFGDLKFREDCDSFEEAVIKRLEMEDKIKLL